MNNIVDELNTINKLNTKNVIHDYINIITTKCENQIPQTKKQIKLEFDNIVVPTIQNYYDIIKYNYNVQQLKNFAKNYKLKISGNKKELITRLFTFLRLSSFIVKIQKVFRGTLQRKYNKNQGPGLKNRNLCTNSNDFITMDELNTIDSKQFFSYMDLDGFIYGFDIASLYNLVFKNDNKKVGGKNPYNRSDISNNVITNMKQFIRLSKILGIELNLQIEDDTSNISNKKLIELRALDLFQKINALGNYSDSNWFLSLNRIKLIKFVRELSDIWHYRAQLTEMVKRNICPPNGDPFRNLSVSYINYENDMCNVQKVILEVLEKFVNLGIDQDSKSLGAYYVLGALTLVNESAATTLPWLFQSVC